LTGFEFPSSWDIYEVPHIEGILFLSPSKTAGIVVQDITKDNITYYEVYSNLIFLAKHNLRNLNILSTNSSENISGLNIGSVEYAYGNDSGQFKVLQIVESGKEHLYILSYFAENALYDKYLPLVSTIKKFLIQWQLNKEFSGIKFSSDRNYINSSQIASEVKIVGENNNKLEFKNGTLHELQNEVRKSVYTNPFLGITLEYPRTLNKTEQDNGVAFFLNHGTSGIVVGVIPSSFNSLRNFTLDHISQFKINLENYRVTNTSLANLFTNPTQLLSFTYDNKSIPYKGLEYITMDGSDAYIFTYISKANKYEENFPLFSDIVRSIEMRNLPRVN
jgi:hypothetical protein